MNAEAIDRAIKALSENEQDSLSSAAIQSLYFRAHALAIGLVIFLIGVALFFAACSFVHFHWPGSLVAAIVATVAWLVLLGSLIKYSTAFPVSKWLLRKAKRCAYRARYDAA